MTRRTQLWDTTLVRIRGVLARTGWGRSTLYNRINEGLFSKPIKVGARASAWPQTHIEVLNAARIEGKSNDEIRALVDEIEAARADVITDLDGWKTGRT